MRYGTMRYGLTLCGSIGLLCCVFLITMQKKGIATMQDFAAMQERVINKPADMADVFPTTTTECTYYADCAIKRAKEALTTLLSISPEERTFDNTAGALDALVAPFGRVQAVLEFLCMVSPDKDIRETAQQASLSMQAFAVDAFMNPQLYTAFKDCAARCGANSLTQEEQYYLTEALAEFERDGLSLPADQLEEIKVLKKELNKLVSDFDMNINLDNSFVAVPQEALAGLEDNFIAQLKKDDAGLVVLGCDYPTYTEIMQNCSVSDTRKKLFQAFQNRAYPANDVLFEEIRAKRQAYAQKLGFASFAALDLANGMAKDEKTVETFLDALLKRSMPKAEQEYELLKTVRPAGVELDAQGRFFQWDVSYVWNQYKKQHFMIDEREIAQYFPVERALQGMLGIYENFLSLQFTVVKAPWLWHDEVMLLEVKQKTGELCGYLYLDLYPRANKYSHACCGSVIGRQWRKTAAGGRENIPGVAIVVANFPNATADMPALFKHSDVETFFHEFGHALHNMLGRTELASNSGTAVKRDFVEMPSQMFEEWMYDPAMLAQISGHYKTGEPLPAELVARKIALKCADSGRFVTRQCMLSLLSLQAHQAEKAHRSMYQLDQDIFETYAPHLVYDDAAHFYASFGHLGGYRARYYSYMWSKVFALDIFYQIKEQGLTNPAVGKRFADTVLARGGSCDPSDFIEEFLGRKPNQKAFLDNFGMN